ncbi:RagB/SusD family nutrient uptake outer membrane protein [Muricauda sp. 334s03]|uniref:RagB/SusD family nutrient uptake outer membrane protein n=1 Tax=Flagellimonas yonaguniensis TaxID=3031325 RepID=A0ABT5Y111_9FLAO|nr:RagB/SusD family nutrient uptake outer membrane protein [[Muricauda] yonaguniensis]MDF0717131.1 RagB/SusD family nutrient uptake outer membrane protein [[Muricauda] yonaguniensis]
MKRIYIALISLSSLFLLNCSDDYLDKNPISDVSEDSFFLTASDLELYTNSFYLLLPNSSSRNEIFTTDSQCGEIVHNTLSDLMTSSRIVPSSGGGWDWTNLRNINYFLENYEKCEDEAAKNRYGGVARFFRAYFYFGMVVNFGDVPWYDKTMEADDEDLYKARDDRQLVIDNILEDLDWAIANMGDEQYLYEVSKYTALALKSRIALFEGTFEKYHGISGHEKYLEAAVDASQELMDNSPYLLYGTGNPNTDYADLFRAETAETSEVILAREYTEPLTNGHRANYYTLTGSQGTPGMPKMVANSYLNADGSRFTDLADYNTIPFSQETANRDPRLSQTIRTSGYTRVGQSIELAPDLSFTITGYHLTKFVTGSNSDGINQNTNDLPVFRFAEILLNYAEAKTELGTITQDDLDKSIGLLRNRVGMPGLTLANANSNPDSYQEMFYPNVSGNNKGLLLEIRRERRVELYMEGHRWNDVRRWKAGQSITLPLRGIYLPGPGEYDLDGNGAIDTVIYEGELPAGQIEGAKYFQLGTDVELSAENLIDPLPGFNDRTFNEERDYFLPIPIQELQLNPNLTQNPNW